MQKQFATVKQFVSADLETKSVDQIETISQYTIDQYFQDLQRTKAHLCAKPLKFSSVNRYVEMYLKKLTK